MTGSAVTFGVGEVEVLLLLPARQNTALEAVAARAHLTVAALLQRVIGDFLRSDPGAGLGDPGPL